MLETINILYNIWEENKNSRGGKCPHMTIHASVPALTCKKKIVLDVYTVLVPKENVFNAVIYPGSFH